MQDGGDAIITGACAGLWAGTAQPGLWCPGLLISWFTSFLPAHARLGMQDFRIHGLSSFHDSRSISHDAATVRHGRLCSPESMGMSAFTHISRCLKKVAPSYPVVSSGNPHRVSPVPFSRRAKVPERQLDATQTE